jgi:hypothetical protein
MHIYVSFLSFSEIQFLMPRNNHTELDIICSFRCLNIKEGVSKRNVDCVEVGMPDH